MKKILVLQMPAQSLYLPQLFTEIAQGSSMLAGSLEHSGYDVTYYDLNMRMTDIRISELNLIDKPKIYKDTSVPGYALSNDEFDTLTTVKGFQDFIDYFKRPQRISNWISLLYNTLIDNVDDIISFDIIAYSIERRMLSYYSPVSAFLFSLLFNNHIQESNKNTSYLTYMGGRRTMDFITECGVMDQITSTIDKKYLPTRIFYGHGEGSFSTYIREFADIDKQDPDHLKLTYMLPTADPTELPGKYKLPQNISDCRIVLDNIISPEIKQKFPELTNVPDISYANYTFSRGCPFRCAFCGEQFQKTLHRDLDTVIDAFKHYEDNGISFLRMFDNNINFNLKWAKDFCNKIVQKNIKIKWTNSANFTIIDDELLHGLSDAGCIKLWWGTESASSRILKLNKNITVEHIENVLKKSAELGIWNQTNMIVNFPTESDYEFELSHNFLKEKFKSGIISAYNVNIFRLFKSSLYYLDPEKYNIEVLEKAKLFQFYGYNELNGKTYDQIVKQGEHRLHTILSDPDLPNNFDLFSVDPLYYSLYTAFNGNTNKIRQVLTEIDNNGPGLACQEQHSLINKTYINRWETLYRT